MPSPLVTIRRDWQQKRCRSAAEQAIEADAGEHADGNRHGVDVGHLTMRIDQRDDEERDDGAGERGEGNLSRDDRAASRAAMGVGEVAPAAWTSGHANRRVACRDNNMAPPRPPNVFAYDTRGPRMANANRLISSVLLAAGVLLVFAGFTRALGFTSSGVAASLAPITALVYAGATWFGPAAPRAEPATTVTVMVFDGDRRIVGGDTAGQPLAAQFPEILRPEIERRCTAALAGTAARFPCFHDGRIILFDALPVRNADGTIVFGMLLTAEPVSSAVAVTA